MTKVFLVTVSISHDFLMVDVSLKCLSAVVWLLNANCERLANLRSRRNLANKADPWTRLLNPIFPSSPV